MADHQVAVVGIDLPDAFPRRLFLDRTRLAQTGGELVR